MNRLVVVSNRVPALAAAGPQAGGLTVALDALMERRGGLWFGWSGQIADAPAAELEIRRLPRAPAGAEVSKVDVVIRLRRV